MRPEGRPASDAIALISADLVLPGLLGKHDNDLACGTGADQWEPLWEDLRKVADPVLESPPAAYGVAPVPPHLIDAIVLDQPRSHPSLRVRNIIDGQQRLTTLQLLLDAAQWVAERHGSVMDAQALKVLVLNDAALAGIPTRCSKLGRPAATRKPWKTVLNNGHRGYRVLQRCYPCSRLCNAWPVGGRAAEAISGSSGGVCI